MANFPKNFSLLYRQELCRWWDYITDPDNRYPAIYIADTMTIFRRNATRGASNHWESYRDALQVIGQTAKARQS